MHVADKKTLKKDPKSYKIVIDSIGYFHQDSLVAGENYQEHVFQFDWSILCSLFPIFIDV